MDSRRAMLVWHAKKIVPGYAFPAEDVALTEGVQKLDDPELSGYVQVDWQAADRWLEEDEEVVGHPRDPFHRVDVRRSSRHIVVAVEGEVLAESRRALLLFETFLPVRKYFPREDVRMDLLEPERQAHDLRLQGARVVLRRGGRARHRVDLSRAAARRRADPGPRRVLRRAHAM